MIIKIPMWAKSIKDDGVACFLAFAQRMCELHGYDTPYFMHKDDVTRIINKRADGLEDWLRRFNCIDDNMKIGKVLDHVVVFSMPAPNRISTLGTPYRHTKQADYKLTDERQKLVWMYLLGCLNVNLIAPEDYEYTDDTHKYVHKNTPNIKEFNITREAASYIKKADR